ncbi:hypothetical protein C2E23DRAFT_709855, partial [Lenzites betulinus]
VGKPATLVGLRDLAQSIDNRYWERKSEQSRDSGSSKPANKSTSSDSKSQQAPKPNPGNSGNSNSGTPKPAPSGTKPAAKTPVKPYADKLGKDGKLTAEERQRRFTNNLCLFCGGAGHSANACPKKTSSAAKARAAQTKPAPAGGPQVEAPPEPKN